MSSDIFKFNHAFLCMAQKLLWSDRLMAMHQLGVTEEVAKIIEGLSPLELGVIADTSTLLVTLRHSGDSFRVLVQSAGGDLNAKAHSTVVASKNWRS